MQSSDKTASAWFDEGSDYCFNEEFEYGIFCFSRVIEITQAARIDSFETQKYLKNLICLASALINRASCFNALQMHDLAFADVRQALAEADRDILRINDSYKHLLLKASTALTRVKILVSLNNLHEAVKELDAVATLLQYDDSLFIEQTRILDNSAPSHSKNLARILMTVKRGDNSLNIVTEKINSKKSSNNNMILKLAKNTRDSLFSPIVVKKDLFASRKSESTNLSNNLFVAPPQDKNSYPSLFSNLNELHQDRLKATKSAREEMRVEMRMDDDMMLSLQSHEEVHDIHEKKTMAANHHDETAKYFPNPEINVSNAGIEEENFDSQQQLDVGKAIMDEEECSKKAAEEEDATERRITRYHLISDAYFQKGNILQRLNHFDLAVQSYERAIYFIKKSGRAYSKKAGTPKTSAEKAKVHSMEEKDLQANLNSPPSIEEVHSASAHTNQQLQSDNHWPSLSDCWFNKGNAQRFSGKFIEAIASYDEIPFDEYALFHKGSCLMSLGKYEDALRVFDRIMFLYDPPFVDSINFCRGESFRNMGSWEKALEAYRDCKAYERQAECLYNLNRFEETVILLELAISRRYNAVTIPNNEEDDYDIEKWISTKLVGGDGSEKHSSLRKLKGCSKLLLSKANALSKLGRWEDALDDYSDYLTINPADSDVLFHKGFCLSQLQRHGEATIYYDLAQLLKTLHVKKQM